MFVYCSVFALLIISTLNTVFSSALVLPFLPALGLVLVSTLLGCLVFVGSSRFGGEMGEVVINLVDKGMRGSLSVAGSCVVEDMLVY